MQIEGNFVSLNYYQKQNKAATVRPIKPTGIKTVFSLLFLVNKVPIYAKLA